MGKAVCKPRGISSPSGTVFSATLAGLKWHYTANNDFNIKMNNQTLKMWSGGEKPAQSETPKLFESQGLQRWKG